MESEELTSSIYFQDDNLQELLSQIVTPSVINSNETPEILNEKVTFSMNVNCLKVEDFVLNSPEIMEVYRKTRMETQGQMLKVEQELRDCNINSPTKEMIYQADCIETAVEQTYNYSKDLKKEMIEELCYLKKITQNWRRVGGDGNCFYRSAMFAWLEYLVFNEQIAIFQKIVADLKIKGNPFYKNTITLNAKTRANISSLNSPVPILIIETIINQLNRKDMPQKERIQLAYSTLLKGFNFSRLFDTGMIIYLRYILYEFILENKEKVFSKDFPVLLGNLLPSQYETDDGKFLFQNYFEEDLLKFYTCAEKLAIYLTPFVLKIDLKVVCYNFGPECNIQHKLFSSYLPNKECLYVFYRRAHYDICYTPKYYKQHEALLSMYAKPRKNTRIIKDEDLNEYEKKMNEVDITQSNIFTRKKPLTQEEIIQNNLKTAKSRVDQYIKCSIPTCLTVINKANSQGITLPCNCKFVFCNDLCLKTFVNNIIMYINQRMPNEEYKCFNCQNNYGREDLINISFLIEKELKNKEVKEALRKKFEELFQTHCMRCLHVFSNNEHKTSILVKVPLYNELLGSAKCYHSLCHNCLNTDYSICKICSFYHKRLANQ